MPHTAIFDRDERGHSIVRVPVSADGREAVLDERAYHAVVARLGNGAWFLNSNGSRDYVRAVDPQKGNLTTIARIIMGEPHRTAICYADGNPLNLRTGNLDIRKGGGGVKKRKRSQP